MIGNAHIDPVWLWRWQEGFHEVKASFPFALERMKEYPDFTFVASSAAFYKWVEESDPTMFAEIQQRVKEGRWGIVGGWWVEPDCNIPAGESFVRHGLDGRRYFKEKFGVTAQTGFNVDSFGHAGTLPQILKKSGLDYYVFLRSMPHASGCYAAHSGIKRWNRLAENRLLASEKLSVAPAVCEWLGINGMRVWKEIRSNLDCRPAYL
jgi:alpha-mannosidase